MFLSLFVGALAGGVQLGSFAVRYWEARAAEFLQRISHPIRLTRQQVLIVRGAGDEASGALSAASFFGWLGTHVWHLAARPADALHRALDWVNRMGLLLLLWGIGGWIVVLLAIIKIVPGWLVNAYFGGVVMIIFALCGFFVVYLAYTTVLAFLMIPLVVTLGILLWPFLHSPFVAMVIDGTPEGTWTVHHVNLDISRSLRHSGTYELSESLCDFPKGFPQLTG
jgi:hypothetical protein